MFAGVTRYVCKPNVTVAAAAPLVTYMLQQHASSAKQVASTQQAKDTLSKYERPNPTTFLLQVCGNDSRLNGMVTNYLRAAPCVRTATAGIDLETMLLQDHQMSLNFFLKLSVVNRKIILLDSLKRHNADVPVHAASSGAGLTPERRNEMLVNRGRQLLLDLIKK
eukprot:TRINITY_DN497_c0_g1_i7.p1 TRINITY_DN497_c0_g1~~TRINITY_DN497_c0_g1_i7.p1  ORF type:complete len:165 (+),score=38.65 TRINITY_DN497_c0_g1_i7:194-688(+)